ncbi:MAG: NAD-dependent epimerase/dehydratase family protein [Gelidibacter sp.]|nr:NAD-dependent epimerase/dehydratase family protein [Gelidibacter sp.]
MDRILITGASGFVGQNVNPYLSVVFDVKGISRQSSSEGLTYAAFFEKEIAYDAIIHLAGKAHDLKKTSNDNDYFEANFELTKKLFDAFLKSDAQKFIYISSVKAVADTVVGVLTEEVKPNPITAYGKSKLAAENYILSHELPATKKVFILRPSMIHGPGNKGNLNLLYQLVSKGLPWPLGAFENQRSFLSIENLCFVIKELLTQQTVPSGVYNVADDKPLSTNELIQLIAAAQSKKARIIHISKGFIRGVAKIGGILHLPLNEERLQKLTENYVVSNNKIIKAIGKPLPVQSKEGLLKTFKSFQKINKNA